MWDFIPFFESRRGLKRGERGRKVSEKGRAEERSRKEGAEKRGGKTFERWPPCDRQEIRNVRKEQTT